MKKKAFIEKAKKKKKKFLSFYHKTYRLVGRKYQVRDHSRREKPNDRETHRLLDDFGTVSLGLSTDTTKIFRHGNVFQSNLLQEFG